PESRLQIFQRKCHTCLIVQLIKCDCNIIHNEIRSFLRYTHAATASIWSLTMKHLWTPWRMAYIRGERTPVEGCIFCNKVNGDDDEEHIVARSAFVYVTLNRYPYNNGHTMVVP